MTAYEDYLSWKESNIKTINFLIANNSAIIARFRYVLAVTDFLVDKALNQKIELDKDEEEIFETGYSYCFDRFNTINLLLEKNFKNDLEELNKYQKALNLLFYTEDFIDELDSHEKDYSKEKKEFEDIEDEVLQCIEDKIDIPDTMFALLDDVSVRIFEGLGIEYESITDIFYDIAIELGMVADDDDYFDLIDFAEQTNNRNEEKLEENTNFFNPNVIGKKNTIN